MSTRQACIGRQGIIDRLLQELPSYTKESAVESYYIFMRENNFPNHMSLVVYIESLISINTPCYYKSWMN